MWLLIYRQINQSHMYMHRSNDDISLNNNIIYQQQSYPTVLPIETVRTVRVKTARTMWNLAKKKIKRQYFGPEKNNQQNRIAWSLHHSLFIDG